MTHDPRSRTEARLAQREAERNLRLAGSIVDTVRDPLVILEDDLTVVSASRAFLRLFGVEPGAVIGRPLRDLGEGQWRVTQLRELLVRIVPDDASFGFEDDLPGLGRRIFELNARWSIKPYSAEQLARALASAIVARDALPVGGPTPVSR